MVAIRTAADVCSGAAPGVGALTRGLRESGGARTARRAGLLVVGLVGAAAAGLKVRPPRLPPAPGPRAAPSTVPLPAGLPAPVERYVRGRFGEEVPLVETVVVTGHGTVRLTRPLDIPLPVRFRFTHVAGHSYRHYIEVTFFGIPVGRVNEWFVDGTGRAEVFGRVQDGNRKWDQGANLGLWIEALAWFPSILVTDPRLRWEAVDDETAVVVVPFGRDEERILVRFDPADGDIAYWEMMRYANGTGDKKLYVNGVWFDDGRPWASFQVDDIALNVPVDTSLGARGLP
jgi:hypothetical protein